MILGTAQFGFSYAGSKSEYAITELNELFSVAHRLGCSTIDTAADYGSSERRIGSSGISKNFKINTKLPSILPEKNIDLIKCFRMSTERLGRSDLNTLFIHNTSYLLRMKSTAVIKDFLLELKAKGKIKYVGISVYDPAEIDLVHDKIEFDVVQAPFNFFDNRILQYKKRNNENVLKYQFRSLFLQGILVNEKRRERSYFPKQLDEFNEAMKYYNYDNSLKFCLKYVSSFVDTDSCIVGVNSLNELIEISEILKSPNTTNFTEMEYTHANRELVNPFMWPK